MTKEQKVTAFVSLSVAAVVMAAAVSTMVLRHASVAPATETVHADVIEKAPQFSDAAFTHALQQNNIQIDKLSVKNFNGIVILRGHADAETAVRAVGVIQSMGADRVANLITPAPRNRDEEIRRDAERELANSGTLAGTRLRISVQDGVLRLTGTVQNEY